MVQRITRILTITDIIGAGGGAPPVTDGLVMHLDAGQIPDLEDTDPVTVWNDVSGEGNDATPTSTSPTWTASNALYNNRATVTWTVKHPLQTANFGLLEPLTFFIAADGRAVASDTPIDGLIVAKLRIDAQGGPDTYRLMAGVTLSGDVAVSTDRHIFSAVSDGASSQIGVNGVITEGNAGAGGIGGGVTIASSGDLVSNWIGNMAEVLVYDRHLTDDEILSVNQYLSTKYAIGIAQPPPPPPVTSDLEVWFPADGQGHVPAGGNVAVLQDWSGFNRNALQTVVANQPTLQAAVLNGKPAIRFVLDKWLDSVIGASFGHPFEVYLVWLLSSNSNNQRPFDGGTGTHVTLYVSVQIHTVRANVALVGSDIGPPAGKVLLSHPAYDGVNSISYLDGAVDAEGDTGVTPFSQLILGRGYNGLNPLSGDIYEMLVYSVRHTGAQRRATEDYLAAKYGLTLAPLPKRIAGLELWVDATQITAHSDGDPVAQWDDESGQGNDLVQGTGSLQPSYLVNQLNGLPVVNFSAHWLRVSSFAGGALTQPGTIIAVCRQSPSSQSTGHFVAGVPGGNWGLNNRVNDVWAIVGNFTVSSPNDTRDTAYHVFAAYINGVSGELLVDGLSIVTGNVGTDTMIGMTLGASSSNGQFLTGDIAEVLLYDRLLTTEEREAVEAYLQAKWATPALP